MGHFPFEEPGSSEVMGLGQAMLVAATDVERTHDTVQRELRTAQQAVEGDLTIPLGTAGRPLSDQAAQVKEAVRHASGCLGLWAIGVDAYNQAVTRCNFQWAMAVLTADDPRKRRAEKDFRIADDDLQRRAGEVQSLLGMSPGDPAAVDRLTDAGVMPTHEMMYPADVPVAAPAVVEVDGRYVVVGSDEGDHVKMEPQADGSYLVTVSRLDMNGNLVEVSRGTVPPGTRDITVNAGDGNDVLEVPPDARINVTAHLGDGNDLYYGGGHPGRNGIGGGGNDTIYGGDGQDAVYGGSGHDTVYGGGGKDSIDGQDGHDTIHGGAGPDEGLGSGTEADDKDLLYGGRGDDVMSGAAGDDLVEGGSGNDLVEGGDGNDIVSGGRDDDVITGGNDNDTLLDGKGSDVLDGGQGEDQAYAEEGNPVVGSETTITVVLDGDPGRTAIEIPDEPPAGMSQEAFDAWKERLDSDLSMIAVTPAGAKGLADLDKASNDTGLGPFGEKKILITPYMNTDNPSANPDPNAMNSDMTIENWLSGSKADMDGGDYAWMHDDRPTVNYGTMAPIDDDYGFRSPVTLYHELAHSWDNLHGGTPQGDYTEDVVRIDEHGNQVVVPNSQSTMPLAEINSVGYDTNGDGQPDGMVLADGSVHPGHLTENALRDELGLDPREGYDGNHQDPPAGEYVRVTYTDSNGQTHVGYVPTKQP